MSQRQPMSPSDRFWLWFWVLVVAACVAHDGLRSWRCASGHDPKACGEHVGCDFP
jgi:hypothetical protein